VTLAPTVVLGVDQASRSGWALHRTGKIEASGVCKNARERALVVEMALALAGSPKALLVVLEDHTKMPLSRNTQFDSFTKRAPSRNAAVIIGMGDARGRWREQLELAGVPLSHFLMVEPRVWRKAVFGGGASSMGTDQAKALAVSWSSQLCGRRIEDDNEAEAVAIASWGGRHGLFTFQASLHEAQVKGRTKRRAPVPKGATIDLEFEFPDQGEGSGSLDGPKSGNGSHG
jgi:hypothetical protein